MNHSSESDGFHATGPIRFELPGAPRPFLFGGDGGARPKQPLVAIGSRFEKGKPAAVRKGDAFLWCAFQQPDPRLACFQCLAGDLLAGAFACEDMLRWLQKPYVGAADAVGGGTLTNALFSASNQERYNAVGGTSGRAQMPVWAVCLADPEWEVRVAGLRQLIGRIEHLTGMARRICRALMLLSVGDAHAVVRAEALRFLRKEEDVREDLIAVMALRGTEEGNDLACRLRALIAVDETVFALPSPGDDWLAIWLDQADKRIQILALQACVRLVPNYVDEARLNDLFRRHGEEVLPFLLEAVRTLGLRWRLLHEIDSSQLSSEALAEDLMLTRRFLEM